MQFYNRIIVAPIIIEGEEQRNNSGILLRLSISIPRAEIREVLKDVSVPLLEFHRDSVIFTTLQSLRKENTFY